MVDSVGVADGEADVIEGVGVAAGGEGGVQAASSAQPVATAPSVTTPCRLNTTSTPRSGRPNTRTGSQQIPNTYQSVGHAASMLALSRQEHSTTSSGNAGRQILGPRPNYSLSTSLRQPPAPLCRAGVVRGVVRPAAGVVRSIGMTTSPRRRISQPKEPQLVGVRRIITAYPAVSCDYH